MNSFRDNKNSHPSKTRKTANFSTDRDEFTQDHLEFIEKDRKMSKNYQRENTDNTTIYGGGSDLGNISVNYETKPPKIFDPRKLKNHHIEMVNSFEEKSNYMQIELRASVSPDRSPRDSHITHYSIQTV